MSARYSADDYAAAARALLPRGRVWTLEPGTVQAQVVASLMPSFERADEAGADVLAEVFPGTTDALLPEWEASLGLPDPCLGPNPTPQQRRDQLLARLTATGGQSAQRYIDFAAYLGFEIAIQVFAPFRAGRSRVGDPVAGSDWAETWKVTIVSGATSADHALFRAGVNRAGDPLASTSTAAAALECELRRIAPAHTTLFFSF